ncbi:hypothetical protein ZWY2020_004046 [Hordeum vulgare]|nr:hypothetical protein ZWY2020_004046 [Hordeum vulgare]
MQGAWSRQRQHPPVSRLLLHDAGKESDEIWALEVGDGARMVGSVASGRGTTSSGKGRSDPRQRELNLVIPTLFPNSSSLAELLWEEIEEK